MNAAVLSAVSALFGSLIGASAPVLTTWLTQRGQYTAQQRIGDRTRREALYSEFIVEASTRYAEAVQAEAIEIGHVVALHALLSRIRLYADDATVVEAEAVLRRLFKTYFDPPLTTDEFRDVTGAMADDPLLAFSKQARAELLRLR